MLFQKNNCMQRTIIIVHPIHICIITGINVINISMYICIITGINVINIYYLSYK